MYAGTYEDIRYFQKDRCDCLGRCHVVESAGEIRHEVKHDVLSKRAPSRKSECSELV